MESHWKFLRVKGGGGGEEGSLQKKNLKGKYEAKLEFPGGRSGAKPKHVHGVGRGIWIFSGTAH